MSKKLVLSEPILLPAEQRMYKAVETGKTVELGDNYLTEHDQLKRMETIAFDTLKDAEEASKQMILAAEAECERLVTEQVEAYLKQGFEEGFEAGRLEGIQQGTQEIASEIDACNQLIAEVYRAQEQLINDHKSHMAQLLAQLGQQIYGAHAPMSVEQLAHLIESSAAHFARHGQVKITIHPNRMAQLMQHPAIAQQLQTLKHLHLNVNHYCPESQLVLESMGVHFDISPQAQLAHMHGQIEAAVEHMHIAQVDLSGTSQPSFQEAATAIDTNLDEQLSKISRFDPPSSGPVTAPVETNEANEPHDATENVVFEELVFEHVTEADVQIDDDNALPEPETAPVTEPVTEKQSTIPTDTHTEAPVEQTPFALVIDEDGEDESGESFDMDALLMESQYEGEEEDDEPFDPSHSDIF